MPKKRTLLYGLLAFLLVILIAAAIFYWRFRDQVNLAGMQGQGGIAAVQLPPGFTATAFAEGLNGPRFLHFGPDGVLYVADRGNGRIVALPDANQDGKADNINVFAADIERPHSLVYLDGHWYVGVPTGVIRLTDSNGDGAADQRTTLIDSYPIPGHSTRTVEFLPDGRMVVSVGSSCNVCEEDDPRRATILVYDSPDGDGEKIFATGLRNAVGLAIHPTTGQLWASNNGRDFLGDELPPETVYIVEEGRDYGWPYCHSGRIEDPEFGFAGSCSGVAAPVVEMQAHSAPLGITFYTGNSFPAEYRDDLFIAFHGSWNRSEPTGYKVVRLPLNGAGVNGPLQDFATGWMNESSNAVDGRPVGLAVSPAGDLFVSDDKAGIIYRISYTGP